MTTMRAAVLREFGFPADITQVEGEDRRADASDDLGEQIGEIVIVFDRD